MRRRACSSRSSCSRRAAPVPSAGSHRVLRRAGCRVRRAPRFDHRPRKSLMRDADLQIGRLGHDRARRRFPLTDERIGADARVLLVDDRRDDQAAFPESRRLLRRVPHRSSRRRRTSCPANRGRRGARRESTGVNGDAMPSTPTVSMCPQNISERPRSRSLEHTNRRSDVPARRPDVRRRVRSTACARAIASAICSFASGAWNQRRIDRVDGDEIVRREMTGRS